MKEKKLLFQTYLRLRKVVYSLFFAVDCLLDRQEKVIVLCYHSVENDKWRFSVSPKEFVKQIKYVLKTYQPIKMEDFEKFLLGNKKITKPSFILTFDDGYKNILQVREFINKKGIKPVIFVLSNPSSVDKRELDTSNELLSSKEISTIQKDGWIIGSHGATHADLHQLSEIDLRKEIEGSKKKLEKILKSKVPYFSYPKSRIFPQSKEVARRAGYSLAFIIHGKNINRHTDKFEVPRVGIDGTHTFSEFKSTISPLTISFRNIVNKLC